MLINPNYSYPFISIEGIDGSGKTLLITKLEQYFKLHNIPSVFTRDPSGTEYGKRLRELLISKELDINNEAEILGYLSARKELEQKVILPALKDEYIVITDRYIDSTIAYQGRMNGDIKLLTALHNALDWLVPNLTIVLDIDIETSNRRIADRKGIELDKFDTSNDQRKSILRGSYRSDKINDITSKVCIDASMDPDRVFSTALNVIKVYFKENKFLSF